MRKNSCLLLGFLLCFVITVQSQSTWLYEFNLHGELVKGPPALLKPGDAIHLQIPLDINLFRAQIDSIEGALLQARAWWEIKRIQLTMADPKPTFFDQIPVLIQDLDQTYQFFQGKTVTQLLDYAVHRCPPPGPVIQCNANRFLPQPDTIINRLLNQYTARMDCRRGHCKVEVPLCIGPDCCGSYIFKGECTPTQSPAVIDLYRNDVIKDLTISWYNGQFFHLDYTNVLMLEKIISLDKAYANVSKYLNSTGKHDTACNGRDSALALLADFKASPTKAFSDAHPELVEDAYTYLLHLAWLNPNAQLGFNPFGFTNPALYRKPVTAQPNKDEVDATVLKKVEALLKDTTRKLSLDNQSQLLTLWSKRDSIIHRNDSLTAAGKTTSDAGDAKKTAANSQNFLAYQFAGVLRNKVVSPMSTKADSALYVRNYYFNRSPDKRDFWYEYPDNEKVALAVHNLPAFNSINLINKLAVFNEQTLVQQEGNEAIANLGLSGKSVSALIPAIPINPTLDHAHPDRRRNVGNRFPSACTAEYKTTLDQLKKAFAPLAFFDSIYNTAQPPPLPLQEIYPDSPELRTALSYPDGGNKAPFEFDYRLTVKDTSKNGVPLQLDSSFYKIGRRRLIELAMGISYATTHTRQVGIDTTNGNFNVSNTETKMQFIVGLKFHLRKIYWGNNNFIGCKGANTANQILERISIFAGMSVPNPLNNFYTGAGVDLIPGLNFNAGVQWFKSTKYSINNNKITDQVAVYRPAVYVAITTDPSLFINIITTFFK